MVDELSTNETLKLTYWKPVFFSIVIPIIVLYNLKRNILPFLFGLHVYAIRTTSTKGKRKNARRRS